MQRVLLSVNGHPDDEVVTCGATMARYASEGARVVAVLCTCGEAGQVVGSRAVDTSGLGHIRLGELERGLAQLGPGIEYRLLGYRDSGMAGSADNNDPRSLLQANLDEAAGRLVRIVREVRPHVILAPNSYGGDGHPDHIRASQLAALAFERAAARNLYSAGDPWAPLKLYAVADNLHRWDKLLRLLASSSPQAVLGVLWRLARTWRPQQELQRRRASAAIGPVTTTIDVGPWIEAKYAALLEHHSQIDPRESRFALRPNQRRHTNPTETYTLVRARNLDLHLPETDLFASIEPA